MFFFFFAHVLWHCPLYAEVRGWGPLYHHVRKPTSRLSRAVAVSKTDRKRRRAHTLPIPSGPNMMLNCSCRTSTPGSNIWHQPCLAEQTNFTAVGKIDSGCGHTQHRFYPAVLCPPFAPFEAQFQPSIPPSAPAPHVHFSGHFSTD